MGGLSCPFIWLSRINLCPTLHAVAHSVRTVAKGDPWTTPLVTGEANLASSVTAREVDIRWILKWVRFGTVGSADQNKALWVFYFRQWKEWKMEPGVRFEERAEKCKMERRRRISKFCLRKECQLRLGARRIIQLFSDLAVRLSFFCQIMIGNKSYWRGVISNQRNSSSDAFAADGNILHTNCLHSKQMSQKSQSYQRPV